MRSADRTSGPLAGAALVAPGGGPTSRHATCLLADLGVAPAGADEGASASTIEVPCGEEVPWVASGLAPLTGRADGPPLVPVGSPSTAVGGALLAATALARWQGRDPDGLPGVEVLGERAALAGYRRQGPRSLGGRFALAATRDGWFGLSLARDQDLELLPAFTGGDLSAEPDPFETLGAWLADRAGDELAAQARLLSLPYAVVRPPAPTGAAASSAPPWRWSVGGPTVRRGLVVDLSSLWAGPLTGHLLTQLGHEVVKVESTTRPDGARGGSRAFFDLLHAGQRAVALDLTAPAGVAQLRALVARAELVIDGSRPRAMARLGIDVDQVVAGGTSWLSITGHGRTGAAGMRPAFGDDAAAAGGLLAWDDQGPVPVGDAVADPLTGAYGAVAALACLASPRGWLVELSLARAAASAAALVGDGSAAGAPLTPPRARTPAGTAADLGADTVAVLSELGITP